MDSLAAALDKMRAAGAHPAELAAMPRRLEQLDDPDAGRLPGDVLEPLEDLPLLDELPEPSPERAREVLDALAVVKLNGGLGTSMGLSGPKSLLEVKPGTSFLDVIATQVLALRERHGARLPLVVMNSASTHGPSLEVLRRYAGLREQEVPLEFLQGREPKLRADDLQPVSGRRTRTWSGARPGTATSTPRSPPPACSTPCSTRGCAGAFVSNSDNLGALADVRVAAWVADEEVPFAMEAVRGTAADRKGGHLARRRGTGRGPDGAARDRAGARRRRVLRRRRPLALLQHEQPLGRPAGAARPAGRRPRRPGAAADRQPQDRRPPRQVQHPGHPAGDGDGRGRRLDPGRAGGAGAALAVRAGEDDERPAGGALGRLRAHAGRADGADVRRARTRRHARRRLLQDGSRLRAALPRGRPVAAPVPPVRGRRAT